MSEAENSLLAKVRELKEKPSVKSEQTSISLTPSSMAIIRLIKAEMAEVKQFPRTKELVQEALVYLGKSVGLETKMKVEKII